MTPTPGNSPQPPLADTEVRIHKLLSRGWAAEAQVLLVLVSTPERESPYEDVWVALNRTAPVAIRAANGWDSIEAGRPINMAELEALDLEWEEGKRPFGLEDDVGRRHWLARFDLSDHPYLQGTWNWFVQERNAEPARTLEVVAWRSRLESRLDERGVAKDIFEPVHGHAHESILLTAVVGQPLFELGVLFVHGIGDHGVRETLVRWSEPIVKLWRDRALAVSTQARDSHARRRASPGDPLDTESAAAKPGAAGWHYASCLRLRGVLERTASRRRPQAVDPADCGKARDVHCCCQDGADGLSRPQAWTAQRDAAAPVVRGRERSASRIARAVR